MIKFWFSSNNLLSPFFSGSLQANVVSKQRERKASSSKTPKVPPRLKEKVQNIKILLFQHCFIREMDRWLGTPRVECFRIFLMRPMVFIVIVSVVCSFSCFYAGTEGISQAQPTQKWRDWQHKGANIKSLVSSSLFIEFENFLSSWFQSEQRKITI